MKVDILFLYTHSCRPPKYVKLSFKKKYPYFDYTFQSHRKTCFFSVFLTTSLGIFDLLDRCPIGKNKPHRAHRHYMITTHPR